MVRDTFFWNYRSFFKDEREKAVTVTGPRYIHMLENLGPESARHPVTEETFFQQDGATSHTARDPMAAVRNLLPNHVICRYGYNTWPSRSPDLSACDFFLWGHLKSQVFKAPAPHTVQELKHRIRQEVKRIPVEMLQRVMGDVRKRLSECLERVGGHLNDVIFGKQNFCFQCVKWVKLKLTKTKFFYIYIVFICVQTKQMKVFTVHDVFKIARFTDWPCMHSDVIVAAEILYKRLQCYWERRDERRWS
jgi:hypothetical protein